MFYVAAGEAFWPNWIRLEESGSGASLEWEEQLPLASFTHLRFGELQRAKPY